MQTLLSKTETPRTDESKARWGSSKTGQAFSLDNEEGYQEEEEEVLDDEEISDETETEEEDSEEDIDEEELLADDTEAGEKEVLIIIHIITVWSLRNNQLRSLTS